MDKEILLSRRVIDPDGPAEQDVRYVRKVKLAKDVTVTVRALTRGEVRTAVEQGGGDAHLTENAFVVAALIDPVMTLDEVAQWLAHAPAGDSVAVSEAIAELSGMTIDAQKSRLPRNGRRSGT